MSGRKAVVIGGGITGVLVGRELLRAGWSVELLEAKHVGAGSSSRTAAGIRQQFSTPSTVRGMRYSVEFYRQFANEIEGGQCPIVQNGYLFLHADEGRWAQAQRIAAIQREAGLTEVEVLDGAEVRHRFPWVGHGVAVGATYCPTDGFLLPHLIYNEGARRVVELGGTLHQNAAVVAATQVGDRLVSVTSAKGVHEADLFVDATNAWTNRLASVLGTAPLPVSAYKRYMWFLGRDGSMTSDVLASMPLTIAPSGTYCRPENADTLLMGRKQPAEPEPDFTYDDQDQVETRFSHDGGIDSFPVELWMELAEVIPSVGEFAGINATSCGFYAESPDHNPFLGFDRKIGNVMRLVGFSGHGAMMGPFTARVAAALAEAGRDLDSIEVETGLVHLDAFRIGRVFEAREEMVI